MTGVGRRQLAWSGMGNRDYEFHLGHRNTKVLNPSPKTGECFRKGDGEAEQTIADEN